MFKVKLHYRKKVWCWWLSRFLWFVDKPIGVDADYEFEDAVGERFVFTREEVAQLEDA